MKPVLVQDAQISTVSVEIKALTIGNKQMTLSVFRQLPREHVVAVDEWSFKGVLWGRVNYHWNACGSSTDKPHEHVVWQDGKVLKRACIASLDHDDVGCGHLHRFQRTQGIVACLAIALRVLDGERAARRDRCIELHGWRAPVWRFAEFMPVGTYYDASNRQSNETVAKECVKQLLRELPEMFDSASTDEDLSRIYGALHAAEENLRSRWQKCWTEVRALDQLFIAV